MASKYKETGTVLRQESLAPGIYSLWMRTAHLAAYAVPGQFVSFYCRDAARLLPRPLSICEIDRTGGALRFVYRVAGAGTAEFSALRPGDSLELLGPLGNGFPLAPGGTGRRALLVGGGIGLPPLVELAKQLKGEVRIIAGYRDAHLFLVEEFRENGTFCAATEDGSFGTHGNVLDAIREQEPEADVIYACGPVPMLRAVGQYAGEREIPCWISLEERMACGIGACLACVCPSAEVDEHSRVHRKRVCRDGPVFAATEVEL